MLCVAVSCVADLRYQALRAQLDSLKQQRETGASEE